MSTSQPGQSDRVETNQTNADITLLENEQVLKHEKPSWINWWLLLVVVAFSGLLGLAILAGGDIGGALLFFIIAGIFYLYVRYARKRSRYIVTNQRVKKRVGLARRSTGETRIADIRGLSTEQGVLERIVGKGSVLIDSGAAAGKLQIRGVADHDGLANTIREQQQRLEQQG